MTQASPSPRRIVIVAPPRVTLLDVTGPYEVFSRAARHLPGAYDVVVAATGRRFRVTTKFGLEIVCDTMLSRLRGPLDTVLVAGSDSATEGPADASLLRWLRKVSTEARRTGSICTGAFDLAAAGLLDGRRATTHWRYLGLFRERHPRVALESDPIYTRDGPLYTSAGITAGIDLSLALVEEDCGPGVAQAVARELVVFMQRSADQAQLSATLAMRMADRDPIRHLQKWVPDHLDSVRGVEDLARLANMSPRNFSRWFRKETGGTPAAWLRSVRLEAAKHRLRESRAPVARVAEHTGFGGVRTLRRALHEQGQTATQLRRSTSNGT